MGAEADPLVFHRPSTAGAAAPRARGVGRPRRRGAARRPRAAGPASAVGGRRRAVDRDSAGAYGAEYGVLAGDDAVQAAWPGLTCARSDDDKWDWADARATADNSGTNRVFGDSWFCEKQYFKTDDGEMTVISDLLWHYCNSTCNATDEGAGRARRQRRRAEGTQLAACARVRGRAEHARGVRGCQLTRFRPYTRRPRAVARRRAVGRRRTATVAYINGTGKAATRTRSCSTCPRQRVDGRARPVPRGVRELLRVHRPRDAARPESAGILRGTANCSGITCTSGAGPTCSAIEDGTFVAQVRDGAIRSASEVRVAVNNLEEPGGHDRSTAAADDGDDAAEGGGDAVRGAERTRAACADAMTPRRGAAATP